MGVESALLMALEFEVALSAAAARNLREFH